MSQAHPHESIALTADALTAFVLAARRRAGQTPAARAKALGTTPRNAQPTAQGQTQHSQMHAQRIPLALRVRGPLTVQ